MNNHEKILGVNKDKILLFKKIFEVIAVAISIWVFVGGVLTYCFQSSYCKYWNVDLMLVKTGEKFSLHSSLVIIIGLVLIVASIILLLVLTYDCIRDFKSNIKSIWTVLVSAITFIAGLFIIWSVLMPSYLLFGPHFFELLGRFSIQYGLILGVCCIVLLVTKFSKGFFGEVFTKFDFQKLRYTVIVIIAVAIPLVLIGIFLNLGTVAGQLKQEFYVYYVDSNVDQEDKQEKYVLVYSDGEKGVFQRASYDKKDPKEPNTYITVPEIRIITSDQKVLALDDIDLRLEMFNRLPLKEQKNDIR